MESKTTFFIFLFSSFFAFLNAEYSDCGPAFGKMQELTVTDCNEDDDKCVLHRNTNVTIQIKFTPNKNIKELKAVVHGIIMNAPIPFPLPNGDGCKDSGVICPLESDVSYTYFTTLPVLKQYPPVSVEVKFELQNEDGEDITCNLIPSRIK